MSPRIATRWRLPQSLLWKISSRLETVMFAPPYHAHRPSVLITIACQSIQVQGYGTLVKGRVPEP